MLIGEIASLLTALLWSGSSIVFTEATHRIGSVQLNINRLIIAAILLAITIPLAGISTHIAFDPFILLLVSGFIGLVFGDGFLFKAFQIIGARVSMLIMAVAPGLTAISGYFFLGETLSFWGIVGMMITLFGIAIVVLERKEKKLRFKDLNKLGLLYGFFGALGQALGLIFAKAAFNQAEIHPMFATFLRISTSILILIPLMVVFKKYKNPFKVYVGKKNALLLTLSGSVLGPYLGITLSLIAISHTKTGIAATLMSTVPVLMLPLLKIIYKEKIPLSGILGAVIAVAGVAILFLR